MNTYKCTNCQNPINSMSDCRMFEKLILCAGCHKTVEAALKKAEKQLGDVLKLYRESLRVALVKHAHKLPTFSVGDTNANN